MVYALLALVALHVVWWFPPGYLADSGNTFAPSMPVYGSPVLRGYPWNPTQDGGFVNARLSHFLVTLPYYGLSGLGVGSWAAQTVWMFTIYWVGSVSITLAAREMFPYLRDRWSALLLVGVAYQVGPGLWYKHMNFATYQLPVGFYWGIPLLFFTVLLAERVRTVWLAPAIGGASLLYFGESATGLTLLPLLLPLLVGMFFWRAHRHGRLRWALPYAAFAMVWVVLCNLWWALTEYQYRAELLQSLATNKIRQTVQPDHLWNLLWFNPLYPTPPAWLPYLGTPWAVVGLGGMFAVCVCSLFAFRRSFGTIAVFAAWLSSLLLLYGYGAPLGGVYIATLQSSLLGGLFRNAERWAFPLDFLTALLFGVGAVWIYDAALARAQRPVAAAPPDRVEPGHRPKGRFRRARPALVRVGLPVVFAALLVLGGWPVLTGSFLVNTRDIRALQVYSVPAQPLQRGVAPPAFYGQMARWIAAQAPYDTSMIFPMPGAWIRDARGANLSWGFQGTGSIYAGLLPTPLILNDAEPLTNASFPAVQAVYQLAGTSGPPGAPAPIVAEGNVTVLGAGRGTNDTVAYERSGGPGGGGAFNWTIAPVGPANPTRTHTLLLNITPLPATSSFLGLWIDPSVPGRLSISWRNATVVPGGPAGAGNNTSAPAPRVNASVGAGEWEYEYFDVGLYSNTSAQGPASGPAAFANASRLVVHFTVNSSSAGLRTSVGLAGLQTFAPDPRGFVYYLESLGADLVLVDRSFRSSNDSIPEQNLSSYAPLLRSLLPYRAAQFGNLTAYRLPNPPLPVEVATNWSEPPNPALAWSVHRPGPSFFVNALSPVLPARPPGAGAAIVAMRQPNPDQYSLSVNAQSPFAVVLLQNFDPQWHAYADNQLLTTHFVANGFANGWWVNRSGPVQIRVVFGPERMYEALIVGSAASGSVLAVAVYAARKGWLPGPFRRLRARPRGEREGNARPAGSSTDLPAR